MFAMYVIRDRVKFQGECHALSESVSIGIHVPMAIDLIMEGPPAGTVKRRLPSQPLDIDRVKAHTYEVLPVPEVVSTKVFTQNLVKTFSL